MADRRAFVRFARPEIMHEVDRLLGGYERAGNWSWGRCATTCRRRSALLIGRVGRVRPAPGSGRAESAFLKSGKFPDRVRPRSPCYRPRRDRRPRRGRALRDALLGSPPPPARSPRPASSAPSPRTNGTCSTACTPPITSGSSCPQGPLEARGDGPPALRTGAPFACGSMSSEIRGRGRGSRLLGFHAPGGKRGNYHAVCSGVLLAGLPRRPRRFRRSEHGADREVLNWSLTAPVAC